MKRTALLREVPQCAAPDEIGENVLAASQIVEHDGKSILNIDLFYDGVLRGRYFADVKEECHNANVDGKWYKCSINNVARVCQGKEVLKGYTYYSKKTGTMPAKRMKNGYGTIWVVVSVCLRTT